MRYQGVPGGCISCVTAWYGPVVGAFSYHSVPNNLHNRVHNREVHVMPNPAVELLAIFERWSDDEGRKNQKQTRHIDSPQDTAEVDAEHLRALGLVEQVALGLAMLAERQVPVDHLRKHESAWTRAVLGLPHGWDKAGVGKQLFREGMMDALRSTIPLLDIYRAQVPAEKITELSALIDEVEKVLGEDSTLPDMMRDYMHDLLQECRRAVVDYTVKGKFDLGESVRRLWVALSAAAEFSQDDKSKSKWRGFRDRMMPSAVGGLIANAPTVIAAITAGS